MDSKKCSKCNEVKPLSDFHKQKAGPGGHHRWCKPCKKLADAAYYTKNKSKVKARALEYRAEHRDEINAKGRKYRARPEYKQQRKAYDAKYSKTDLFKKCQQRYAEAHPDKMAEIRSAYNAFRQANRSHFNRLNREYYHSLPKHVVAERSAEQRARRAQRCVAWADPDKIREFYVEAKRLTELTGIEFEVDHKIPLQGRLASGLHVEHNLQVIPRHENRTKKNAYDPMDCELFT